jgi:hypothetical protein
MGLSLHVLTDVRLLRHLMAAPSPVTLAPCCWGRPTGVLGLTQRLAACFRDGRNPAYTEHAVETLVMQRIAGITLGYEELTDRDQLRHDPVLATLAGKLAATREDCAPPAGKNTLNRLELSRPEPTRYARIAADTAAIEALFVELFLDAHAKASAQITLDLDATDDPLHSPDSAQSREGRADFTQTRRPAEYRGPARTFRLPELTPEDAQPVKTTVTRYSHVRHFKLQAQKFLACLSSCSAWPPLSKAGGTIMKRRLIML